LKIHKIEPTKNTLAAIPEYKILSRLISSSIISLPSYFKDLNILEKSANVAATAKKATISFLKEGGAKLIDLKLSSYPYKVKDFITADFISFIFSPPFLLS
jgi:hypothetical protein